MTISIAGKDCQILKSYFCIEFQYHSFFNSYNEKTRYLGHNQKAVLYRNEIPFVVHPYPDHLHHTGYGFYLQALPHHGSGRQRHHQAER